MPVLAATPDGKVIDFGCSQPFGILEVKCPSTKLHSPVKICFVLQIFYPHAPRFHVLVPRLPRAVRHYEFGVCGSSTQPFNLSTLESIFKKFRVQCGRKGKPDEKCCVLKFNQN